MRLVYHDMCVLVSCIVVCQCDCGLWLNKETSLLAHVRVVDGVVPSALVCRALRDSGTTSACRGITLSRCQLYHRVVNHDVIVIPSACPGTAQQTRVPLSSGLQPKLFPVTRLQGCTLLISVEHVLAGRASLCVRSATQWLHDFCRQNHVGWYVLHPSRAWMLPLFVSVPPSLAPCVSLPLSRSRSSLSLFRSCCHSSCPSHTMFPCGMLPDPGSSIAVGVVSSNTFDPMRHNVGVERGSWAVSKTGKISCGGGFDSYSDEPFAVGDVITVEVHVEKKTIRCVKHWSLQATARHVVWLQRRFMFLVLVLISVSWS